jgi:predicted RNA-binding Zn-ribbon protein involved in translation (DUF1610 family)
MSTPRAVPFYCPFCGEEQLRPTDLAADLAVGPSGGDGAGWRCESCDRVFTLTLVAIGGDA